MFAKIFNTEEVGQILVMNDASDDDNRPQIRFYFQPEGLGVCATHINFNDECWDEADTAFEAIDEAKAIKMVEGVITKLRVK